MTVVGKILVFLNLVFSLVVGGLVAVVYVTRTNWEESSDKYRSNLEAVKADRDQTVAELDNRKKANDKDKNDYETKLAALTKEKNAALTAKATAEGELATLRQANRDGGTDVTRVQATMEARVQQVKELEATADRLRKEKEQVVDEYRKERGARIQADVQMTSFKNRNIELEEKVKEMAKALIKTGPSGTVVTRKRGEENPPPEHVEGKVTFVDTADGYLKLSVGSDAGLTKGHTMKLFRLSPIAEQSRYLGTVEILSVRAHEAVARPLKPLPVPARAGDRVASRLSVGGN
jgi:hypothetical protein